MIDVAVKVKIPFLWGKSVFKKSNWSQINLIVGPNGSGKTLLAQAISDQFKENGFAVSFVKSKPKSTIGNADMEGLVCKPKVDVLDRCGNRIIVKIKAVDF